MKILRPKSHSDTRKSFRKTQNHEKVNYCLLQFCQNHKLLFGIVVTYHHYVWSFFRVYHYQWSQVKSFSKESTDQPLKLLKLNPTFGTPNCSLAHTSKNPFALSTAINFTPWIIDSRAFHYMTSLSNLFHSYSPCLDNEKIWIVDGSFSPMVGKGLIKLSNNIILKSILHFPKLACNLLSISKLSKDSNCFVTFFAFYCVFTIKTRGWQLRMLHKQMDYYFDKTSFGNKKAQSYNSFSSNFVLEQIEDCSILQWESCHLWKDHCVNFFLKALLPIKSILFNPQGRMRTFQGYHHD